MIRVSLAIFVNIAKSGDSSYFHKFSEFYDSGKSCDSDETGHSCEFVVSDDSCKYGKTCVTGESDDPDTFGESTGFSECGDSGEFCESGDSCADGNSCDSGQYCDFVEYGDSAYSDEFDDSCEYGDSGDSCDCGVSGKSNKSGYLAHNYMMLCYSARNKHDLFHCVGFLLILICECINFNLRGVKVFFLVLVMKVVSFQNYGNGGGGVVE